MSRDIFGYVPPPSADFTGSCPCGCGAVFKDGKQLFGEDLAWYAYEDAVARLRRVRAAALSDTDLQKEGLRGLRDFLLRETETEAAGLERGGE